MPVPALDPYPAVEELALPQVAAAHPNNLLAHELAAFRDGGGGGQQ